MTNGVYPNSNGGATISGAGSAHSRGPAHVVRYALNCGPGLNIPLGPSTSRWAHFSDDHGLSERTHREIADAIDAGSVSTSRWPFSISSTSASSRSPDAPDPPGARTSPTSTG